MIGFEYKIVMFILKGQIAKYNYVKKKVNTPVSSQHSKKRHTINFINIIYIKKEKTNKNIKIS